MTGNRNAIRLDLAKLFDMTMMDRPFFLARNNHQQTFTPPHQQETRSVTQCSLFRRTPKIEHLKKERRFAFAFAFYYESPLGFFRMVPAKTQQHNSTCNNHLLPRSSRHDVAYIANPRYFSPPNTLIMQAKFTVMPRGEEPNGTFSSFLFIVLLLPLFFALPNVPSG